MIHFKVIFCDLYMKQIFLFLFSLAIIIYGLSEFVGDRLIKQIVESNISNSLDRDAEIGELKINYLFVFNKFCVFHNPLKIIITHGKAFKH